MSLNGLPQRPSRQCAQSSRTRLGACLQTAVSRCHCLEPVDSLSAEVDHSFCAPASRAPQISSARLCSKCLSGRDHQQITVKSTNVTSSSMLIRESQSRRQACAKLKSFTLSHSLGDSHSKTISTSIQLESSSISRQIAAYGVRDRLCQGLRRKLVALRSSRLAIPFDVTVISPTRRVWPLARERESQRERQIPKATE